MISILPVVCYINSSYKNASIIARELGEMNVTLTCHVYNDMLERIETEWYIKNFMGSQELLPLLDVLSNNVILHGILWPGMSDTVTFRVFTTDLDETTLYCGGVDEVAEFYLKICK